MARPRRSSELFLARLEKALSASKPRDETNLGEMAATLGMTPRNLLETYIKPDAAFPILEVGSEGKSYRFKVRAVLQHLIKRTKADIAAHAKRNAEQAERLALDISDEDRGASLEEIRQLIDLSLKVQREKRDQQREIDPVQVGQFIESYNQTVRDTLMGSGSAIDPTGELPPAMRGRFDDHMRDLCLNLEKRVAKFIGEYRAGSFQAGAG